MHTIQYSECSTQWTKTLHTHTTYSLFFICLAHFSFPLPIYYFLFHTAVFILYLLKPSPAVCSPWIRTVFCICFMHLRFIFSDMLWALTVTIPYMWKFTCLIKGSDSDMCDRCMCAPVYKTQAPSPSWWAESLAHCQREQLALWRSTEIRPVIYYTINTALKLSNFIYVLSCQNDTLQKTFTCLCAPVFLWGPYIVLWGGEKRGTGETLNFSWGQFDRK